MYLQLPVCHTRSGRVWGGTAFAKRSEAMKAPVGLFKRQRGLRQQMEGIAPTSTPQQEHFGNSQALEKRSSGWAENFQELKICGHGTVLALTPLGKGVFMDIEVNRMSPSTMELLDQLSVVCNVST